MMGSQAQALWRWIETYLMKDTKGWNNNLDYGVTVDEDHMKEFVDEKFGSYGSPKWFTIQKTRYKMKAMGLQNKNNRAKNAYGSVKGGGENKVNILCFKDGSNETGFNLHIQVRRQAAVNQNRKKAANREAAASGGWSTA